MPNSNYASFGLGRIEAKDDRDKNHPMRALLPVAPIVPFTRLWRTGPILNQGQYPHCVGYSWAGMIASAPLMRAHVADAALATRVYHEAQKVDEWPGTDYEGTSVRAGAKVLEAFGYLEQYVWGESAKEVRDYI